MDMPPFPLDPDAERRYALQQPQPKQSPEAELREIDLLLSGRSALEGHRTRVEKIYALLQAARDRDPRGLIAKAADQSLHENMDARVWAKAFIALTKGYVDEETAVAWFANAIMCGWDNHYWSTPEYRQLVAAVPGPPPPSLLTQEMVTIRQLVDESHRLLLELERRLGHPLTEGRKR